MAPPPLIRCPKSGLFRRPPRTPLILPSIRAHAAADAVERFLAVVRSEHGGETPAEAVD